MRLTADELVLGFVTLAAISAIVDALAVWACRRWCRARVPSANSRWGLLDTTARPTRPAHRTLPTRTPSRRSAAGGAAICRAVDRALA